MWPRGYSAAEICTMFPVWTSQKGGMLCKLFRMIIYADDTTSYSTLDVLGSYISKKLNL